MALMNILVVSFLIFYVSEFCVSNAMQHLECLEYSLAKKLEKYID